MEVYGHRGSRDPGPESSVAAVVAALVAGADGVEVDVRRSRDGVLVCLHDATLAGRPVRLTQAAALRTRGAPTPAEVLDAAAGHGRVVLEVKRPWRAGTVEQLLALLAERGGGDQPADDVVISSFDPAALAAVRAGGGPATGLLVRTGPLPAALRAALSLGCAELHAPVAAVVSAGPGAGAEVRAAGLRLVAWTVKPHRQAEVVAALTACGVDGIIVDDPAGVVALLRPGRAGPSGRR